MFNDINKRYAIQVGEHTYFWSNEDERALIINEGFTPEVIDALEVKTSISTSHLLSYLNIGKSNESKYMRTTAQAKSVVV